VIHQIQEALQVHHLTLHDIVLMHVFLVGDPANRNALDFAGFTRGYKKFFDTAENPNMPARVAIQVVSLPAPGALVEIEVVAAKTH